MIDFSALSAPFPPSAVSWRIGSVTADGSRGMALAYLDARDVMDRLDSVCGPDGWQCKYSHVGSITVCDIGIWYGGPVRDPNATYIGPEGWIWKADGAGQSDIEAEKGALSDSFKRAAVRWGIGRYLYHLPSPWVEVEKRGRTSIIKESEYAKLEGILAKASAGLPQDKAAPPPPDADVMAASKAWVAKHSAGLSTMATEADVKAWHGKYAKDLLRLKAFSPELCDQIMLSYGKALQRVQMPT